MDFASLMTDLLWTGGLAAIPLALFVGLFCRTARCRPATRHALWCAVLASFITPLLAGLFWRPNWFESTRVMTAADSLARIAQAKVAEPKPDPSAQPAQPAPPPAEFKPDPSYKKDLASAPAISPPPVTQGAAPTGTPAKLAIDHRADRDSARARIAPDSAARGSRPAREASGTPRTSPAASPAPRAAPVIAARDARAGSTSPASSTSSKLASGPDKAANVGPSLSTSAPVTSNPPALQLSQRPATPATSHKANPAFETIAAAPLAPSAPAAKPTTAPVQHRSIASWTADMKAWLARALEIRDTVAALPPLPASIWAGGVAIALIVFVIRVALVTRLIRRGSPAPAETRRLVQAAAIRLSVSPVPETVIVADRVSPMIWCGLRPRLVLPEGLWNELDDASRFAVLVHELAHLRRRDHRLCWIEFLIGIVYWWHPAAWWARRRVRDEADLCCDAWVTSIIPLQRRAYAEALVATKSYLSVPGRRVTPGLGIMTGRTKRMARRLTMVMTQRVAPRTSALGGAIAIAVLAAGMFVTPGLACPPESQGQAASPSTTVIVRGKATKEAQKAKALHAEQVAKAKSDEARAKAAAKEAKAAAKAAAKASKPAKSEGGAAPEFFGEAPALEAMKAGRGRAVAPSDATNEDAEIRRLEEQLRALEARIEKLYDKAGRQRSSIDVITPRSPFAATAPSPAMAPSPAVFSRRALAPTVAVPAQPPVRVGTPVPAIAPTPVPPPAEPGATCMPGPLSAPIAPAAPGAPAQPAPPAPARAPSQLSLQLDPLGALATTTYAGAVNLEPQSLITAVAEPADETEARSYVLPDGKLEALTELMARQDVPVLIERHDDKIVVHATATQHEVFGAFVHLINPESPAANLGTLRGYIGAQSLPSLNRALTDYTGRLNELAAAGRTYEALKQPRLAQLQNLEHYRSALGHLNVQRESIENQAEQLREQAEQLREMAEQIREKAEALREQLQSRGDASPNAVEAATRLMNRASTTEARASELDARADALDTEVADIEFAADQLDDEIDALADQIEEQADDSDFDIDVDVDIDDITGQVDVQFDHDDAHAADHEDCDDDSCCEGKHDDCDSDSDHDDHDDDSDSDSDTH